MFVHETRPMVESEKVGFEIGHGPEQVHLGFTEKEDEMRVMFVTADGSENFVRFGRKEEDLCHAPTNHSIGWRDPGYVHDGIMKRLKKGRRYYYQVEGTIVQLVVPEKRKAPEVFPRWKRKVIKKQQSSGQLKNHAELRAFDHQKIIPKDLIPGIK